MAKWVNTVPQGIAGTGNATIYGDNPVAAQFGNQLARLRQNEYNDELLKQREAERVAQRFRDNQLAASEGRLWAQDIGALEQQHIQKGIELRQKGIDPYGSKPEALEYQKERRRTEGQQGFRKATETRLNALNQLISANPDKYDPRDINAVNEFFNSTKLEDAYNKNLALPQLRERFKVNEYLKPLKAVTMQEVDVAGNVKSDKQFIDRPATENAIIGALRQDERGREHLSEITGGIPINEVRNLSASLEDNKKKIETDISGDPRMREELAAQGIVPGTPAMQNFINVLAQKQTAIKRNFDNVLSGYVAASAQGANLHDKQEPVKPDLSEETLAERIRHNREMEARARATADKKGADSTAADVRRDWIQSVKNVQPNALEKLVAAGNASQDYDKSDKFKLVPSGGSVSPGKGVFKLHVPAKVRYAANEMYVEGGDEPKTTEVVLTPANDYTINLADPNFETTMNTLIGDITGARVDLGSIGARGSNLKKSPPSTVVKAPAPASAVGKVPSPTSFKHSASNGKEKVYSNDGVTWYTKDGKKVQ